MEEEYELVPLNVEEGDMLTKDLQEVLAKHNAEMQVKSSIVLFKRVALKNPGESVPTPYPVNNDEGSGEETSDGESLEGEEEADTKAA